MTKIITIILMLIVVISMILGGYRMNAVSNTNKTSAVYPTNIYTDKQTTLEAQDFSLPELLSIPDSQVVFAYILDTSPAPQQFDSGSLAVVVSSI